MNAETIAGVQGITEDDIANYLVNTPEFFERQAQVLAAVQLGSPHGRRAVSLQERQADMLRERIRGLERKIMEMIRASQDNMTIAARLHRWSCSLLAAADHEALGAAITQGLADELLIPQVAVRVWDLAGGRQTLSWVLPASEDARVFATSLASPYCGLSAGFEAEKWLDASQAPVQSLAMIPLRHANQPKKSCFGLLVLGSSDATRFQSDMGTEFLEQVGELASASLAPLVQG